MKWKQTIKFNLLVMCYFVSIAVGIAQNENTLVKDSIINVENPGPWVWDMSLELKTMNPFRGLLPSNAPTFSTQAGVKYKSWILGAYGGGLI